MDNAKPKISLGARKPPVSDLELGNSIDPALQKKLLGLAHALNRLALSVGVAVPIAVLWTQFIPYTRYANLAALPILVMVAPVAVLFRVSGAVELLSRGLEFPNLMESTAATEQSFTLTRRPDPNSITWHQVVDGLTRTTERMYWGTASFDIVGASGALLVQLGWL